MTSVTVRNLQRTTRVDVPRLQRFANRVVRKTRLSGLSNIDVLLVSDRRIAALHRQFMNIGGPTDVITFQHGEIFISVETAKENARRFHTTTMDELKLYIVHGLLHLHGFDDTTPAKARLMAAAQKRIVAEANEHA